LSARDRWLARLHAASLAAFVFGVATGVSKIEQLDFPAQSGVYHILAQAGFLGVVAGACGLILYGVASIVFNKARP
jgi:hypothetical protein